MNFRIISVVASLLLAPAAAFGMTQSQIPSKFAIPWGNSAASAYIRTIPQSSQIGIVNCAASLTDGFPPLTFLPIGAGGCPPFGQDFNGILKQVTQWNQWQAVSSGLPWDTAFSTSVGGYPKASIVQSNVLFGRLWLSTADNNTTNPDATTSANWIALPGTNTAGTVLSTMSTTAPANSVSANGLTVGNASSNATGLANADTFWLFSVLWTSCTPCTLFNSSGGVIARGANAIADFNANSAIATPNMNGAGLVGADSQSGTTTTNLIAVPVTSGSRLLPGSILGENFHTQVLGEVPAGITSSALNSISVNVSGGSVPVTSSSITFTALASGTPSGFNAPSVSSATWSGASSFSANNTINVISTNTFGSPFNDVQRSVVVYWWLAL